MKERNVFLYWDDKPNTKTPDYILLCRQTILKNCGKDVNVILVNRSNISQYLENIPENLFKIKEIAHIADYVRVALLVRYGGIWLDSDCILLKNLSPIFDMLNDYEYVGYCWKPLQPSIGFMASRKDCPLLKEHLDVITDKINKSENFKFSWAALGYDSLWKITPKYKDKIYLFSHEYFSPIHYSKSVNDFSGKNSKIIMDDCYTVMLFNKMFSNSSISKLTEKQILEGDNLLSNLFKRDL